MAQEHSSPLEEKSLTHWQIQSPLGQFTVNERAVSSGDHSFTATADGRYTYCFSNDHWGTHEKEVSFNVHGIVYVPENEAPQDPLEKEGMNYISRSNIVHWLMITQSSICQNFSTRSRTSSRTWSCASEHTATPPRARIQESSGGAYSSWALSSARAYSKCGGCAASSR